jgi:predicted Zn-dependent peptidase
MRTSIAARCETSGGLNGILSPYVVKGVKENPIDKALFHLEHTTLDDVMEYARKTFAGPCFKAILLPEE